MKLIDSFHIISNLVSYYAGGFVKAYKQKWLYLLFKILLWN